MGGYESFCENYLLDHLKHRPEDHAVPRLELGIVLDAESVLTAADENVIQIRDRGDHSAAIHARIPGLDYLRLYDRLSGVLDGRTSRSARILHDLDRPVVLMKKRDRVEELNESDGSGRASRSALETVGELERVQRDVVYRLRGEVVGREDVHDVVLDQFDSLIEVCLSEAASAQEGIQLFRSYCPAAGWSDAPALATDSVVHARELLRTEVREACAARVHDVDPAAARTFERRAVLTALTIQWRAHLGRIDELKNGFAQGMGEPSGGLEGLLEAMTGSERLRWRSIRRDLLGYLFGGPTT